MVLIARQQKMELSRVFLSLLFYFLINSDPTESGIVPSLMGSRRGLLRIRRSSEHVFPTSEYEYEPVDYPVIRFVEPEDYGYSYTSRFPRKPGIPKGFPTGGASIFVHGRNLKMVEQPMIYVVVGDREFSAPCIPENNNKMRCESPAVPKDLLEQIPQDEWTYQYPIELEYGFKLGRNISRPSPDSPKFQMYPDPVVFKFPDANNIKPFRFQYLTIRGEGLDKAARLGDFLIRIGTEFCSVTSLSRSELTCLPPETQPPALGQDGNPIVGELPQVVVSISDRLIYLVGQLRYDQPATVDQGQEQEQNSNLSEIVAGGLIAGASVVIDAFVGMLFQD